MLVAQLTARNKALGFVGRGLSCVGVFQERNSKIFDCPKTLLRGGEHKNSCLVH